MTLEKFLNLIQDGEARIKLKVDGEEDWKYHHFWLSDFRSNLDDAKYYRDYGVSGISFIPKQGSNADIIVYIKK